MERKGIGMISNSYAAQDFTDLNIKVDSSNVVWEKAISIYSERFIERYFNPIDNLLVDSETNGFAIMAINCLLVDTFYQFEEGLDETKQNKVCYVNFLRKHLGGIFDSELVATKFYKDIRCGILHSAQTKNGSMLSIECHNAIELFNGRSSIKVNVEKFAGEMHRYFDSYIKRLRDGDISTRENFITKMHYICR